MNLLQHARCLFGVHRRDRRRAWHDGPVARGYCSGCGKLMIKDRRGWHLDDAVPPDAAGSRTASSGAEDR